MSSTPFRVNFVSLGCAKNLIDSERMLGLLCQCGGQLVSPDDPADITIINTCGFIQAARTEALENIQWALDRKKDGTSRTVMVTGCLSQLWKDKLFAKFPDLDAVVGLSERESIGDIVVGLLESRTDTSPAFQGTGIFDQPVFDDDARLRLTDPSWSYLRVSEGCDQLCTFCTIPSIRGPFRSKSMDRIIGEAGELVDDGAVELNLIGQETSGYGRDLHDGSSLAKLITQLADIDDLHWIRILYTHPATLSDDLIDVMADCPKVVPYLDIPLQHINDRILKRMNRHITRSGTERILDKLRTAIPDILIRTTMLVGFPSETDAEFAELLDFVTQQRFGALGTFTYSCEPGSAAAKMDGQIDESTKQQRLDAIMTAQQGIAFDLAGAMTGQQRPCLILDELSGDDTADIPWPGDAPAHVAMGRLDCQGPEIDPICLVGSDEPFDDILMAPVTIVGHHDYDTLAVL